VNPAHLEKREVFYSRLQYGFNLKSQAQREEWQMQPITPVKKQRPSKHKGGLMQGRRLFGNGDDQPAALFESSNKPQTLIEPESIESCRLPTIETGTGPYNLLLDKASGKIVPVPLPRKDRFDTEFVVTKKIGEGEFGIAYRVTCKSDGEQRAVKKQKERYMGVRDRDLKR